MLQSNTDATHFQLQPAPRPKCRKRPHNPPPARMLSRDASSSADGADTFPVAPCFEEDNVVTPKAPLFNISLPDDSQNFSDSDALSATPSRRSRSSTISIASASSTKHFPSSSATRFLSFSSPTTPTRRPLSLNYDSASATVTVMLSSRSPSPSSPLFPRRTLMRSISSTCINIRSPTITPTASPGTLRKRMGWRGAQSAEFQNETAIIMSPGSPLTPHQASALHTPTQASITSILRGNREQDISGGDERDEVVEPLSATLKALGAKRRTQRFRSTCVPVQSPLSPEFGFKSPVSCTQERFELMTATRKIFHLPTWVRFEANHHARTQALQDNRDAAEGFAELREQALVESGEAVIRGETLPKTSRLGDAAPGSPNGELLAGFRLESPPKEERGECVVSVVRRPSMAALREKKPRRVGNSKGSDDIFGAVRSALPGIKPQHRIKDSHTTTNLLTPSHDATERRDGWGGILTRSSWFPRSTRGPLVSPTPERVGLKKMILQPSKNLDEEWEDVVDLPVLAQSEPSSFLEVHPTPRFFQRQSSPSARDWFPFLSRSRQPTQRTDWIDLPELNTWHTQPLKPAPSQEPVSSEMITRGDTSIENRPLRRSKGTRIRVVILSVTAFVVLAIVANVVIIAKAHSARGKGGPRAVYDPLVGKISPGISTTTSTTPDARSSTIAKAAQLSEP